MISYLEHDGPHSEPTRARVGRLRKHFGPKTYADQVDQIALNNACTKLLRSGAKPSTRLREIITPARAVLTHGASRRMCPLPVFRQGKTSSARTEWLSPNEVDRITRAAAYHLRPLLTSLAATGARLGEALTLEWHDVDLPYSRVILRDTKNGRDRIVELCPRGVAALERITGPVIPRNVGGGFRARATTGQVFRAARGEPYAERRVQGGGQIKSGWSHALKLAGITKNVTPHSLRHSWASWHYAHAPRPSAPAV